MTKSEQQHLENLEQDNARLLLKVESLESVNREQSTELRHYRMAVSALKWLWDQANQQIPFQL